MLNTELPHDFCVRSEFRLPEVTELPNHIYLYEATVAVNNTPTSEVDFKFLAEVEFLDDKTYLAALDKVKFESNVIAYTEYGKDEVVVFFQNPPARH